MQNWLEWVNSNPLIGYPHEIICSRSSLCLARKMLYVAKLCNFEVDVKILNISLAEVILLWLHIRTGPRPSHRWDFEITLRNTTVGRTPLNEGSAHHRGLCLTKYKTHNRQTSLSPAEFESVIPESKRPQNHALDRAAAGPHLRPRGRRTTS